MKANPNEPSLRDCFSCLEAAAELRRGAQCMVRELEASSFKNQPQVDVIRSEHARHSRVKYRDQTCKYGVQLVQQVVSSRLGIAVL
jgi:hypothetical protein